MKHEIIELTDSELATVTGGEDISWSSVFGGAIGGVVGFFIGGAAGAAIGGAYGSGLAAFIITDMSRSYTPGLDSRYPPILT